MDTILTKYQRSTKKDIVFSVMRVPFFLEPNYDENKVVIETNRERLEKKWGGKEGWLRQKNHHNLKGRGMKAGIPYFNLDRLTSNTMASHRLIQKIGKAYGLEVSEALYDALNIYYFVDGHSLNDHEALAQLTHDVLVKTLVNSNPSSNDIMTSDDILKFLKGNEGRKEIEMALYILTNQLGIHGIPKFLIQGGRFVIDGAAESNVFIKVFEDIIKEENSFLKSFTTNSSHDGSNKPLFANVLGLSPTIVQRGSHFV